MVTPSWPLRECFPPTSYRKSVGVKRPLQLSAARPLLGASLRPPSAPARTCGLALRTRRAPAGQLRERLEYPAGELVDRAFCLVTSGGLHGQAGPTRRFERVDGSLVVPAGAPPRPLRLAAAALRLLAAAL